MKNLLRIVIGLIYLATLFFSLTVLVKPGAAIFFWKSQIKIEEVIRDGDAFEYRFKANHQIFNPDTLMILEDQKILKAGRFDPTVPAETGTFALKEIGTAELTLRFIPTTLSDLATNGHTYRIYIRPYLLSSNYGGIVSLLLLPGFIIFFGSNMLNPQKRKVLFGSPFGVVRLWLNLFNRPNRTLLSVSNSPSISRMQQVKHSAVNIVLIAYLYVFLEWVFFVTKPSFMSIISIGEKVKIFFITGFAAALFSLLTLPVIFLIDIGLSPLCPSFRKYAYHFPAAFLGACLSLILIDNFTYTIFNFGIVYSRTLVRVLYALVFLGIFFYVVRKMMLSIKPAVKPSLNRTNLIVAISIFIPSLVLAGFTFQPESNAFSLDGENSSTNNKPNIIILSTDGLNAENMSVYGYERDTTPYIARLASSSLLGENNFTNAAHSMGSDTALLTGKLPFETRVLYPPDTLKGPDRYQHLPGILKREGYRTVSLGVPYYVDVNTINFLNGFDAVNCQENAADSISSSLSGYGFDDTVYMLMTIEGRIKDRFNHIFFIKDMVNPFALVTESDSTSITEQQRLDCLHSYIDNVKTTGKPLFAHVHLMGTHGAKFSPAVRVFSKDLDQYQQWMTEFYDDAILNFDIEVEKLVSHLSDLGIYDNTILVLYTDHGQQYVTDKKLPLIIHFPNDQYARTVKENTQNLDIAPTILDYIGIQKPSWMDGSSLLGELDPKRLIFAGVAHGIEATSGKFVLSQEALKPPFYQFGGISVIQCQNTYYFNLVDMTMRASKVADHHNPCPVDTLDTQDMVREKVGTLLKGFGYQLPDKW